MELVLLLFGIALGNEQDTVPCGEIGEGLGYARKKLNLLVSDRLREAVDTLTLALGEGIVG